MTKQMAQPTSTEITETNCQPITRAQTRATAKTKRTSNNWLEQLWHNINNSKDKLLFIQRKEAHRVKAEWHLVQVDLEETEETKALNTGAYHIRYFIRHFQQSKHRPTRQCKFWPLIRELRPDGYFGAIVVVAPNKIPEMLKKQNTTRTWYQDTINIDDTFIAGPFNFSRIGSESHRIHDNVWETLKNNATGRNINTDDIDKICPLQTT